MNAKTKIHNAKLAQWIQLFKEQSESGLSVSDWLSQKGLSRYAYYYWKRMAKEAYADTVMPEIIPLDPIPNSSAVIGSSPQLLPDFSKSSNLLDQIVSPNSCNSCNSCNSPDLRNSPDTVSVSFGDVRIDIGPSASDDLITKVIGVMRHA
jgi:hypothetical protein